MQSQLFLEDTWFLEDTKPQILLRTGPPLIPLLPTTWTYAKAKSWEGPLTTKVTYSITENTAI